MIERSKRGCGVSLCLAAPRKLMLFFSYRGACIVLYVDGWDDGLLGIRLHGRRSNTMIAANPPLKVADTIDHQ